MWVVTHWRDPVVKRLTPFALKREAEEFARSQKSFGREAIVTKVPMKEVRR